MTNYDAIKEMSVEEMAAMFYIFAKPFLDAFDITEEQRKKVSEAILEFLNTERASGGD